MPKKNGFDRYLDYQYRQSGSFFKALFDAIKQADSENLARVALGFPEEVRAYLTWTTIGIDKFAQGCATHDGQFEKFCAEYGLKEYEQGGK